MFNKFIVVEGNDGCGKSSAVKVIIKFIESQLNGDVDFCREPGGTVLAESIRGLLLSKEYTEDYSDETELLLMFASRSQLIKNVIKPSLDNGKWVVSDRFTTSTYAYQGYGRGIDIQKIKTLEDMVVGENKPALTIILDCPPEISLSRVSSRGESDRIEDQKIEFFNKSREGYLKIANDNPKNHIIINANKPLEDVSKEIIEKFHEWFLNSIDN